jgi:replicative DNA helicase
MPDRRELVDAAERAVIGSILAYPGSISEAVECLSGEDFADPRHGKIFVAAAYVHQRGVSVDLITVFDQLERSGGMRGNLSESYMSGLAIDTCCLPPQVPHHAEIIVREAGRRKFQLALGHASQAM